MFLLTLAPHTSHRIQPLDFCVYGPLKTYFEHSVATFQKTHVGRIINQKDVAGLFATAYLRAATTQNVVSGFEKTGLWPPNRYIFLMMLISCQRRPWRRQTFLLDGDHSKTPTVTPSDINDASINAGGLFTPPITRTSPVIKPLLDNSVAGPSTGYINPMAIKPVPKMKPNVITRRRKAQRAEILTSTPIKGRVIRFAKSVRLKKNNIQNHCDNVTNQHFFCLICKEPYEDPPPYSHRENTNASTTEKESEQLSPIVDSGATVADDEKSNVEDLSSIFGDFDKEQSTSTASTSSKIICLFCDRSQKRCGKKLINLTFPSSDKVPQQIKDMAKILSKLQHQTIAYHLPCYAVYQSKEKRSMEESTDSSYSKYRQLHQLAFQSISNFIETEIIENNKVMYLAQLFLRYQALLLEFGNYEIDFDDIQDYRSETLQKKLIRKFGDRITIEASTAIRNKKIVYKTDMDVSVMANNFKLLETKNDYEFENVAYYLRSCIKNIDAHPLPRNVTADDIIRGECDIPEQLFDFMRNVIQGPNISDENSDKLKVKITSICSDIIYAVTRGTCKPAKV
ncbi:hypothetical protein HF086_012262 [Spodoptera exigua]|uniref:DDE-1 domain-containing protein n=1 Tax=Spodoptera exigua TaxID=7107 RepID=A0A922MFE4_SPOEX|nr:hypothetical protein HF086_012262 [Spodoptera exigua]